ncbi:MAG: serine/threonine protein kinase [Chloroflexi bacterium]|nr:serine/threonine protein kinase [Chloroflexota bacterium]
MYEPPKDQLIGKTLGQYAILEEVGRGGMATVYRARQSSMNRIVAVKVLPPALMHDPGFYERFQREVDVISHLEHPHILPIYDFGQFEGMPFIVMRYLGGGSLAQMIRRGPPPFDQLERPLTQVASALDYAHQKGIIHRDIKPGNIMLDENGNAYLSDFGIARVLGSNMTGSAVIGTPAYMSPEQAMGGPIDGRSDIYALGIVLFELLTGREPYQAETPMALVLKHINEPMPPARSLRADIPNAIDAVIAIATAKEPENRFPSAADMARAFGEAARNPDKPLAGYGLKKDTPTPPTAADTPRGTKAAPEPKPRVQATMVVTEAGDSTKVSGERAATQPRRSPLPLIIGAVIVIAALALGALVALPALTPPPGPLPTPTPFSGAQVINNTQHRYSIYIPAGWLETDLSSSERTVHVWQDGLQAYVAVVIPNGVTINSQADYERAIAAYERTYDEPQLSPDSDPYIEWLDQETAPDGTLRRSYRLLFSSNPAFPSGQTDRFYFWRGQRLLIVEMYTAYSTGDTLVPTMQLILDSLQTLAPAS